MIPPHPSQCPRFPHLADGKNNDAFGINRGEGHQGVLGVERMRGGDVDGIHGGILGEGLVAGVAAGDCCRAR